MHDEKFQTNYIINFLQIEIVDFGIDLLYTHIHTEKYNDVSSFDRFLCGQHKTKEIIIY